MKIAYCFCGHLRTGRKNLSLIDNLIGPYPGDVFIHTYPLRDAAKSEPLWHPDRAGADEDLSEDDIQWIKDTYKPKALHIDEQKSAQFYMPPGCSKMAGRRSVFAAHELRRQHEVHPDGGMTEPYDVVFHVRFDLMMLEPFKMPEVIQPNTIYSGNNLNYAEQGYDADIWWFAKPDAMDKVTSPMIPHEELELIPSYGAIGEMFFTSVRRRANLNYIPVVMKYDLLRSFGPLGVKNGVF